MPYGLYISAEGAHAQSTRLDLIANNLANVDTVGFKRDLAVFQARYAEAIQQGQVAAGSRSLNDVGGGVTVRETKTDFAPGPQKPTKNPTDLAIRGQGFFAVKSGDETLLTRAGNFQLNARGELQTQQGYPVLSDTGTPIVVGRPNDPWEVTDAGDVRQGDDVQKLALVSPNSLGDLVKVGENLFRPLAQPRPLSAGERQLASGYLEMSGTQPTNEMIELIEASRALESNVNMMQAQDQMLNGLFNRLLKT